MKKVSELTTNLVFSLFVITAGFGLVSCDNEDDDGVSPFSPWDTNDNGVIERAEFDAGYDNNYFVAWDSDGDEFVDEDEWNAGFDAYYVDADYDGVFTDWDGDADTMLDNDEFLEGTFVMWDEDDSGTLDSDEYGTWYYDY